MLACLSCLFGGISSAWALEPPELSCSLPGEDGIHRSSDGVVELRWTGQQASSYQLQQQTNGSDFDVRYVGPDLASVRTGLSEGDHVFRVRAIDAEGRTSEWADIWIQVEYMDPARVRLLLITGGIVVLATTGTIIFGHLNHPKEDLA